MSIRLAHRCASAALALGTAGLVLAGSPALAQTDAVSMQTPAGDARFARFVPSGEPTATRLDYSLWNEALNFFVFSMGASLRERAPTVQPNVGTRRVYGHTSGYRLEANRVTFSYLDDEVIQSLSDYRRDLEMTADDVDIALLDLEKGRRRWRVASASRHDLGQLQRHRGDMPDGDVQYLQQAYQHALNNPWGVLQP